MIGPPSAPEKCKVTNNTAENIEVQCQAGFHGGMRQLFLAEVYDEAGSLHLNQSAREEPQFSVESLQPGTTYTIKVSAYNEKGRSQPVVLTAATLKVAEQRVGESKTLLYSPINIVLMAIVGVLVTLVLVLFLVKRWKKNKSQTTTASSDTCKPSGATSEQHSEAGTTTAGEPPGEDAVTPDLQFQYQQQQQQQQQQHQLAMKTMEVTMMNGKKEGVRLREDLRADLTTTQDILMSRLSDTFLHNGSTWQYSRQGSHLPPSLTPHSSHALSHAHSSSHVLPSHAHSSHALSSAYVGPRPSTLRSCSLAPYISSSSSAVFRSSAVPPLPYSSSCTLPRPQQVLRKGSLYPTPSHLLPRSLVSSSSAPTASVETTIPSAAPTLRGLSSGAGGYMQHQYSETLPRHHSRGKRDLDWMDKRRGDGSCDDTMRRGSVNLTYDTYRQGYVVQGVNGAAYRAAAAAAPGGSGGVLVGRGLSDRHRSGGDGSSSGSSLVEVYRNSMSHMMVGGGGSGGRGGVEDIRRGSSESPGNRSVHDAYQLGSRGNPYHPDSGIFDKSVLGTRVDMEGIDGERKREEAKGNVGTGTEDGGKNVNETVDEGKTTKSPVPPVSDTDTGKASGEGKESGEEKGRVGGGSVGNEAEPDTEGNMKAGTVLGKGKEKEEVSGMGEEMQQMLQELKNNPKYVVRTRMCDSTDESFV
ncbi:hypothetical protein Pmani_036224 [Petrolisthes manimaculis]|uniref:Fibronectin type-III domain-containing protein n=1 Tax=Petrolisthes manimaculis TaxID=1843537 RepID=A0AAE1NLF6_9EUCA|nr:hypothetical protein Pmani_036224 [Petrolisthes manimaculis]